MEFVHLGLACLSRQREREKSRRILRLHSRLAFSLYEEGGRRAWIGWIGRVLVPCLGGRRCL